MDNLENLFRWEKPRKTIKEWFWQDFLVLRVRPSVMYFSWIGIGVYYALTALKMGILDENTSAMLGYMIATIWFGLWAIGEHFHNKLRRLINKMSEGWGRTIDHWNETIVLLKKTEQERDRLQERIDNMLKP